jgi:hypothetical protein
MLGVKKRAKAGTRKRTVTFPPTSVRVDPDLLYRARQLALKNKHRGLPEGTFSQVVGAALAEYLKKSGA